MKLKLYRHNHEAYQKAESMIDKMGRAAVVHPTGTGKSYIAFAFASAHPDKQFLWLSPNEYIFRMQIQNVDNEQGIVFSNITYHTYQWMVSKFTELDITPDYIVLDEFHRTGAPKWGQGVEVLLDKFPNAKLLGLTATHIRYLDGKRNMAEELFAGCVASEMSICDAMARGILPIPKYIISTFSYHEKLAYYKSRIDSLIEGETKEQSQKLLEQLKRNLQKSQGLSEVFGKHIEKKSGKYIVFCANTEHLYNMIAMVPEWFRLIDRQPHVYVMHTYNPESEEDLQKFVGDGSRHLKLLFTIEMLNEGIHVHDVDGVILLRPTVSPIIYRQQIGRALAAGKVKTPLIFDLVNNFENLFYINDLQEEYIETKRQWDGSFAKDKKTVDGFEIIDELRESRELFALLQKNLELEWDDYYELLKKHKEECGSANVPRTYVTPDGVRLGKWLNHQKHKFHKDKLLPEHVEKLNRIGLTLAYDRDIWFENWMRLLQEYKDVHGHLHIPTNYKTDKGECLGSWCCNVRVKRKEGKLTRERFKRLDVMGFPWDGVNPYWQEGYTHAKAYYKQYGNLDISKSYICEDGYELGEWMLAQRKKYRKKNTNMPQDQVDGLNSMQMDWKSMKKAGEFEDYVERYRRYVNGTNNLLMPKSYVDEDGVLLGEWLVRIRGKYRKSQLSQEQIEVLEEIGFVVDVNEYKWMRQYEKVKLHYEEYGSLRIFYGCDSEDKAGLHAWIHAQRIEYRKKNHGKLNEEKIALLEQLNIGWDKMTDISWERGYVSLIDYVEKYGNTLVPVDYKTESGYNLGRWIGKIKGEYIEHILAEEKVELLEELGMIWENRNTYYARMHWNKMYEAAKKYADKYGSIATVPHDYESDNGEKLGAWIVQQRQIYRGNRKHSVKLTKEKVKMLDEIGMVWEPYGNVQRKADTIPD